MARAAPVGSEELVSKLYYYYCCCCCCYCYYCCCCYCYYYCYYSSSSSSSSSSSYLALGQVEQLELRRVAVALEALEHFTASAHTLAQEATEHSLG